jgi:signal transduction histidine kinase
MFKKLRNRILLLNALTICVVIVVSFAVVFLLTIASVEDIISEIAAEARIHDASDPGLDADLSEEDILTEDVPADPPVNDGAGTSELTSSQKGLHTLLSRFLFVGALVLAAVILISLFFANRAVRPVREAWERQRRFIAYASHEMKTPLMTISANHDALLEHLDETVGSQRRWIDYARAGTERMGKLVADMLDLAEAASDHGAPRVKDAPGKEAQRDVCAVIEEELALLRTRADKKKVRIAWDRESAGRVLIPARVEGDARRVIAALAENAVKYADAGGSVSVAAETSTGGGRRGAVAAVTVTNTGAGISADDMPHIVDNFYQADKARTTKWGGYGLGLSIAKALANRSGFRLTAASEPGVLTTFRLLIPVRRRPS